MPKRSKINKVADGKKATETKIAQWGPDEIKRAWAQANWTMLHPNSPKSDNPNLRSKVYKEEDFARVQHFKEWAEKYPNRSDIENPHSWDKL